MSLNTELAALFARMASIMEIKGDVLFKVIAFQKVSRILKESTIDLKAACEKSALCDIEGVGKSSQKIIAEYVRTGRSTDYEELATSVPAGLIPLLEVPGLGPKTISMLWKQRGVTNEAELVKALDSGAMVGLKGIGEKKIDSIRQGLAFRAQFAGRMGIGEALPIAESLLERLRNLEGVSQAQIAGSLRRRRETIGDVDLLCSLKDYTATPLNRVQSKSASERGEAVKKGRTKPAGQESAATRVVEQFVGFPEVQRILGQGNTKASVITLGGLQVDLRIVPAENFGAALLYFTGSKDHNVKLRGLAQDLGMTLNEWGLYRLDDYERAEKKIAEAPTATPLASLTEIDVYKALGLAMIEPEMREDRGEVQLARQNKLPQLIDRSQIRGDLHSHTTASDGVATIEQMAAAAAALGYEYLAITDHSKSQILANGLTAERLLKHVKEIHKVRDRLQASSSGKKLTLLAGCEVDILADGSLDFEDAILAELDIVIASPHVSLKQDSVKATDRLLRAIDRKYVNVIGHPTGRLINSREGLPLDFARIAAAAAVNSTALEINAGYPRLDLDEIHARAAIEVGVLLSIDTDAHSTEGLEDISFGLGVARRAWVTASNVINCWEIQRLQQFLARKR